MYTLIQTAMLNGVDPQAWLAVCSTGSPITPSPTFPRCSLGVGKRPARSRYIPPLPPDPRRSPMATIYLAPSPEIAATRLPTRWSGTTLAVNQKALALLDKLKGKPEDNDTSKSLAGAAAKKRQELSKLSGAAF